MNIKVNLNIFFFLVLFFITNQIELYALIMLFALIHEIGHLLCGVLLGFEVENFRIMPLGFSIEFKIDINDYNKKILKSNKVIVKKLLINIAGPLVNIIIILLSILMNWEDNILYSNLLILVFNLIPIYPLDGGRIIKNLLKICIGNKKAYFYQNKVSNFFTVIITVISSIAIYYYKNIAILIALVFIWALVIKENKRYNLYCRVNKIIDKQAFYI